MLNKRVNIFTGHFGSGKTEVAVNFALKLSEMGKKTAIVDFDIVNPYFRTTDARDNLEKMGIWVVTPLYANTNVDVPALPAEIYTLFEKKDYNVVFDVGGDDVGARALSRYNEEILQDDYEMLFVINTRRPMTDSAEKIEDMVRSIEESSRLQVTGLVNNTNLLYDTEPADIINGHKLTEQVSGRLGIPIKLTSGFKSILEQTEGKIKTPMLYLNKFIKLPWE